MAKIYSCAAAFDFLLGIQTYRLNWDLGCIVVNTLLGLNPGRDLSVWILLVTPVGVRGFLPQSKTMVHRLIVNFKSDK